MRHSVTLGILCGGRSQRMGRDKGLVRGQDDETLVGRAVRLWSPLFNETLIIVHNGEQSLQYQTALASFPELRIVCDFNPVLPRAALTGIATGLHFASHDTVMAVAVDQLALQPRHFEKLLTASRESPSAFSLPELSVVPLPSLWRKRQRDELMSLLSNDEAGIQNALLKLGVQTISGEAFTRELLWNGNTANEVEKFFTSYS